MLFYSSPFGPSSRKVHKYTKYSEIGVFLEESKEIKRNFNFFREILSIRVLSRNTLTLKDVLEITFQESNLFPEEICVTIGRLAQNVKH